MRAGWQAIVIPTRALYAGFVSRTAYGRGPFGIYQYDFQYDFMHEDAGEASVTFLFHRKTGFRLATFMTPELAMSALRTAPTWRTRRTSQVVAEGDTACPHMGIPTRTRTSASIH
jgi:hypothetical protein